MTSTARRGDDAFFALAEHDYLRGETKNYVPQLIAAALIAKEPAKYGMKLRTLPPFAYDSVFVPASTPLAAIAQASGAPLDSIRELNPQVLRGVTPPGARFLARVPVGHAEGFDSAFAALDPARAHGVHARRDEEGPDVRVGGVQAAA